MCSLMRWHLVAEQIVTWQLLSGRIEVVNGGGTGMAPAGRVLTIVVNCH